MCFLAQPGASTRMSQTPQPFRPACVRESPGQLARLASPPELGKPNTTHLFGSAWIRPEAASTRTLKRCGEQTPSSRAWRHRLVVATPTGRAIPAGPDLT